MAYDKERRDAHEALAASHGAAVTKQLYDLTEEAHRAAANVDRLIESTQCHPEVWEAIYALLEDFEPDQVGANCVCELLRKLGAK